LALAETRPVVRSEIEGKGRAILHIDRVVTKSALTTLAAWQAQSLTVSIWATDKPAARNRKLGPLICPSSQIESAQITAAERFQFHSPTAVAAN
jgi:hypothetical protein